MKVKRIMMMIAVCLLVVSSVSFGDLWKTGSQIEFDGNVSDVKIGPDGFIYVSTNYFGDGGDNGNVHKIELGNGELTVVSGLFKDLSFMKQ
jgi:hypothetical protein